jgi:hypothetical protein
MPLDISFQPMRVLIDGHDGDGRLILVNDHLAAVILRLDGQSHAPEHKGLRTWVCERSKTLETRTQQEPWCPDACSRDLCPRAQTVVRLARRNVMTELSRSLFGKVVDQPVTRQVQCLERQTGRRVR